MCVYNGVQQVNAITGVVQGPPQQCYRVVEFPEYTAADDEHQVVEYSQRHDRKPLETKLGKN